MLPYIIDLILVAVGAAMLKWGYFGVTKQMGFVPLTVAAVDGLFASSVQVGLTPVLSFLAAFLQIAILLGSALMLYEDRVHARNKQQRRRRRREAAAKRLQFHPVGSRRQPVPMPERCA